MVKRNKETKKILTRRTRNGIIYKVVTTMPKTAGAEAYQYACIKHVKMLPAEEKRVFLYDLIPLRRTERVFT